MISLIDFILNIAGLLLWLNWLSRFFDPLAHAPAATLVGTLRKADPSGPKQWRFALSLLALLLVRAVAYWEIGSAVAWTPSLHLGAVALSFRSDFLQRMLLFSLLSFIETLCMFYFWLLLLSAVNTKVPDTDPLQKLVRLHLGRVERWPRAAKLLLPFAASALLWMGFHPLLAWLSIVPPTSGAGQLTGQGALIGLLSYLGWKYLIVGILVVHTFTSYVYFGNLPFWNFINITAQHLLAPLRWIPLQLGRVDFSPLVGIALVFLVSQGISYLLLTNTPLYRGTLHRFLPF
jgi:uncharacterized protein YggT (Ycf19 family)